MSTRETFMATPAEPMEMGAIGESPETGEIDLPNLTSATIRLWKAFAPLALERRRWALAVGAVETFRPGALCQTAGEVAVVVSGCLATEAVGSEIAAEILGPGQLLAIGAERTVSGRWITEGELYRVGLADWFESAGQDGMLHLLAAADHRRAGLERRIVCATTHRATARVADLFLSIHEASPQPSILLSQEQMGGMLGLRRTTVNGSCRTLELGGGTRTRRGQIRIIDAKPLALAACGCRVAAVGAPAQINV